MGSTALIDRWLALWNGELDDAAQVAGPDFRVHIALPDGGDGSALRGPDGLALWVGQARTVVSDLVFTITTGPIVRDDLIALRWSATGVYGGGFPGAAAMPGAPIAYTGADFLRVAAERVVEYWGNADTHLLLAQLQVGGGLQDAREPV